MNILGISAFYHDSAAALVMDGRVVAAAQEERFTRIKHDANFPKNAIQACLERANLTLADINYTVFYEKPFIKFERLIETYTHHAPRGFYSFQQSMPLWLNEKLFQKKLLIKMLRNIDNRFQPKTLCFSEHHISHAASAFYPSPFKEAAILTLDGVGEWATTTTGHGQDNHFHLDREIHFPHSLGLLYSAFTYYTGFKVNSGEYKVMGLAPYGKPTFVQKIYDHLIDVKDDGSFRLNMDYFNYCVGLTMTNHKFHDVFGGPPRHADSLLTQREMDLAASIQAVTEDIVLKITRDLHKRTQSANLCMAGGVALNCVANGKILKDGKFKNVWVQPASGDAGGALGAALAMAHDHCQAPRPSIKTADSYDAMAGSYLGPSFTDQTTRTVLQQAGAVFHELDTETMIHNTCTALEKGHAIGWFQGRMEYGPRALGNRSILADPHSVTMQSQLNLKIKFRESFRPFAPSILFEDLEEWFDLQCPSPYMLLVASVLDKHRQNMTAEHDQLFGIEKLNIPRSTIPAVTHIDYSARIQTVHRETNPLYHRLLSAFKEKTGCPLLVNTSFNVRGEPIVCTPSDAFRCFMGCELDTLVIGNFVLYKTEQNPDLLLDYKNQFTLD